MNNKNFIHQLTKKIKVESSNNQLTINVEQQELKEQQPNKNAVSLSGSQLELMLEKNEAKAQELTLTWIDKWKKMEQNEVENNNPTETTTNLTEIVPLSCSSSAVASGEMMPDVVRTKKFSSGFMVESDLPYIVALNNDALDSDIRVYYIRPGETVLGCDETDSHIGSS